MAERITKQLASALVVAALLSVAPAEAGSEAYRFNGKAAAAEFYNVDDLGCVYSFVYVFASESTNHTTPGRPQRSTPWASVAIYSYDVCSEDWSSSYIVGFGEIEPGAFRINGRLNSARLSTTLEAFDWNTWSNLDLAIDLTWIGSGEVNRQSSSVTYAWPTGRYHYRYTGSGRAAAAAGVISDGVTNFIPKPADYASLFESRGGFISINRF